MTSPSSKNILAPTRPLKQSQVARRLRQLPKLLRSEGLGGLSDRVRRATAGRLAPATPVLPLRKEDLLTFDLAHPFRPEVPVPKPSETLIANWVMTPPAPGSGGHTTLFRMIRYLEAHGYRNRVYFYDVHGSDHLYYEAITRNYYDFHGFVGNVDRGMDDAHMVFATGWPTAYAAFNSHCTGKRFYFIQDFEPLFYPTGGISSLAENTYLMGFHGISIGTYYAKKISSQYGMQVDTFEFGCDTSRYQRTPESVRSGVAFYVRLDNARRGCELGLMALEIFAAKNPQVSIHVYGDKLGKQGFPFHDHGRITPNQINELYNRCRAGLSLSFTNVSLAPLEMLAAGCIPVVNDTPQARTDLKSPYVVYAPAYPQALAAQLEGVVSATDFEARSAAAAASVGSITWNQAGASFDNIVRRAMAMA